MQQSSQIFIMSKPVELFVLIVWSYLLSFCSAVKRSTYRTLRLVCKLLANIAGKIT